MGSGFRAVLAIALLVAGINWAAAESKGFRLAVAPELSENGFLKYVLPRFSLKTGIRIEIVGLGDEADAILAPEAETGSGTPVFEGQGQRYLLKPTVSSGAQDHVARFGDWLTDDTGQSAVTGYAPDGVPLYGPVTRAVVAAVATEITGDADAGAELSLTHCGRCHVIGDINRMNGIGSTPSFQVLRAFDDWENRFRIFYVLRPHAAFTQVEDLTLPFDESLPPPIAPVEVTLEDIDAILAYVSSLEPADLGRPIQVQ